MSKREYKVSDLFYDAWDKIKPKTMARIIEISLRMDNTDRGSRSYGILLIAILRAIRRNGWLVNKINVDQAVDIFNDLAFIRRSKGRFENPWLFFPIASFIKRGHRFTCPKRSDLPMSMLNFNQLCYADAAFSAYCVLSYDISKLAKGDRRIAEMTADADLAISSLMAILYTPAAKFDINKMENKAKALRNVKWYKKILTLYTYANIRQFIVKRCPNLFPMSDEVEDEKADHRPVFTGKVWQNLRYDLAESPVFQGLSVSSNAMIYDALDFLEKKRIEQIEADKAHGKA